MSRLLLLVLLAILVGCASLIDSDPMRLNNGSMGELADIKGGGESLGDEMSSGGENEEESLGDNWEREMIDGGISEERLAGEETAGEMIGGEIGGGDEIQAGSELPQCVQRDEECNGLDDDCDSQIDEEISGCCTHGISRTCGLDVGSCTVGTQSCENGEWSRCDGRQPSDEVCDGADNDCDQLIDEGLLNTCGQCGTVPQESCNREDDDCDGRIDERVTNACGECGPLPSEVCDQQDNDCDGRTDERVTNACGECGPLSNELCDGQDNDCDGRVDEGLSRGTCTVGQGQCLRSGQEVCINGQFSCNVASGNPVIEVCNGADDDCDNRIDEREDGENLCIEVCNGQDEDGDGRIDEDVINACGQCGALPVEICNGIDDDCDQSIDESVINACGDCGLIPNEVCDGEDNDCDGEIDENVLNACGLCGALPNESCDGADNDCDGQIDETFPNLGENCQLGLGECIRDGVFVCSSVGTSVCNAIVGSPEIEICDQKDNDCDGSSDEDFNFESDAENCGQCNRFCFFHSNRCVNGNCVCGPDNLQCRGREECIDNLCVISCGEGDRICP